MLSSLCVVWVWACVCDYERSIPYSGARLLPFIVQGREGLIHKGERAKREKVRGSDAIRLLSSVRRSRRVLWALLMTTAGCPCPIPSPVLIVADGNGDGALLMTSLFAGDGRPVAFSIRTVSVFLGADFRGE